MVIYVTYSNIQSHNSVLTVEGDFEANVSDSQGMRDVHVILVRFGDRHCMYVP